MNIVLPICPVLLHLGPTFKYLYLCLRCLETFWLCQNLRRGPPYWISGWPPYVLHYFVSHFLLHFGRNINTLYTKENVYYVDIVIIRPPYRNSRWPPHYVSLWPLHCRFFSVSLSIPRYLSTYHSNSRLLIAGPITFAKWGAFQVCLETIVIPLVRLNTFAWHQFKAIYLTDRQCDPFRNITGSFGCLPSPISNVWKFRLFSMLRDICENSIIHAVLTFISPLVRQYMSMRGWQNCLWSLAMQARSSMRISFHGWWSMALRRSRWMHERTTLPWPSEDIVQRQSHGSGCIWNRYQFRMLSRVAQCLVNHGNEWYI